MSLTLNIWRSEMSARAMLLAVAILVAIPMAAQDPEWARGLCGEALKEAVKAHCSPVNTLADSELWSALLRIESVKEGEVVNRFGGDNFLTSNGSAAAGVTKMLIADKSWWMPDYALRSVYTNDLHVNFVCDEVVLDARRDYMPGEPSGKVLYDGGTWKTGEDALEQGVWSFPEGYGGELARAMLYAACVYPADLWVGGGAVFMEPGSYPSLSVAAIRMLLEAHDNEAPTERERERCERVSELQGNYNPFVKWPDLVTHIWGDKKDVPYCSIEDSSSEGADNEGEGDDEVVLTPLRGIYTHADKTVDLVSPYVPDDASWTIDGEKVEGRQISVSDLLPGKHELKFESAGLRGKIVILIAD